MQFGEKVTALTQDHLLPKVVDSVLGGNVLALRLIGKAKRGAGESIKKAFKYENSGSAGSFSGLDTFTAAELDTKSTLQYFLKGVRIPVAVSGMAGVANGVSQTQVTNLVKNSLEESQSELMDEIGDQIYGDGTGNSNKDLIGLGAIVDDGTDVATIGGKSRTTYPVLDAIRTASGGTMNLAKLATLYSAVCSGTQMSSPTLMVSDESAWDLYEQLLTPTVRENYTMMGYYQVGRDGGAKRGESLQGTQGFTAVTYKGIPFVRDEKATEENVFMLNENWIDYYGWDASGMFGYKKVAFTQDTQEGVSGEAPISNFTGFNWSGFRAPTNQFSGVADIVLLGNLTTWQPRRQGRLTGVNAV